MAIKAEMAARKLDPSSGTPEARAAEESLAELTDPDSTGDGTDGPLRARAERALRRAPHLLGLRTLCSR